MTSRLLPRVLLFITLLASSAYCLADDPKPAITHRDTCPSLTPTLTFLRVMGGVDVSAAASTDPAAKFLGEASFESPFVPDANPFCNRLWFSGYARLASIQQPGAVSGLSDVATYVSPLVAKPPNQIVASAETNLGVAFKLFGGLDPDNRSASLVSFVVNGGVITPLSPSQANPTIYTVSQQLYSYYTAANNATVAAACTNFDATKNPCYVAYIPQDRSRLFRDYAAGLTFRKYWSSDGKSFGFPGVASITIGQNEYVTGGELRNWVLHTGASFPVAASLAKSYAGALYVYGSFDINVSKKNTSTQQFLLQPASVTTLTTASSNVADISVLQPNRDRYRFGFGLDLGKLIPLLHTAVDNAQAPQPPKAVSQ